ncbi:PorT family protein [Dysgonomonas sp. Marseille-P4677]|uniref:porin family protein n=1 Tax=Dysgonomonas sp. Marseille-P4677 TaxID=2364790 RepID=UPI001A372564|nr:porin family protein [Dysgonomonas sp. Marseille-P4677]MBK5721865.1 PorT family protein [Dysgonomonas sp. Marseille-P4677]
MFLRNFLTAICIFIAAGATAQSRFTFGVKGGVNLSESTNPSNSDSKVGFNAGFTVDYQLAPNWYLMSGIGLTTKGVKTAYSSYIYNYGYGSSYVDPSSSGYTYYSSYSDVTQNLMYLQLPIHLGHKIDIGKTTKLVFSAGPYVAYGIGGKTKGNYFVWNDDPTTSYGSYSNVDYNSFDSWIRRFDVGMGASMGIEFGKFSVNIGYDWGLVNVANGMESKNRNGSLSVGYKF